MLETVKVAINGLGRIGRATLKIVMDTPGLDLVGANDLGASDNVVYLLKYDTVYGRYETSVQANDDGTLTVGEHRLTLLREENPARLPWKSLNVDVVFESRNALLRGRHFDHHVRSRHDLPEMPSFRDSRSGVMRRVGRDFEAHEAVCAFAVVEHRSKNISRQLNVVNDQTFGEGSVVNVAVGFQRAM